MENIIKDLKVESLVKISEVVDLLKSTSSIKDKEIILKQNKDIEGIEEFLNFIYNPHLKFGVSEDKLEKIIEETKNNNKKFKYNSFYEFLEILSKSNINDDLREQIGISINMIENSKVKEMMKHLLIKDIKAGLGSKTIDKVFKGLLPKHEVQLAKKYEPGKTKIKGKFFITEKLDGIRCTAYFEGDTLKIKTRQGKDILGLVEIEEVLISNKNVLKNYVLDGELLSIGSKPEDIYKHTIEKVQNKNERKTGIEFRIFDIISLEEFLNKKSKVNYSYRRKILEFLKSENNLFNSEFVNIVPVIYEGTEEEVILPILDKVVNENKEGLMINLDKEYECKRTSSLLKVKKMYSMDLKIIGFEEGTGKNKNNLGALLVDFKGNKVGVGSGLSDSLREEIWNNKEKYLNKIAEIQYFEISKDKNNIESLRFPVFKCFRNDKNEVSYY